MLNGPDMLRLKQSSPNLLMRRIVLLEFRRRELYGGVSGVDTGKLHVFGYSKPYLAVVGNGIHFYFLGVLHEFGYNYGVLFDTLPASWRKRLEFVGIRAYVHGRAGEDIARAHELRDSLPRRQTRRYRRSW